MIREEEVYRIGEITKRHGVRGEVNLSFTDDVFDRADSDYLILKIDGILVPFFMESYRFKNNSHALVKFEGVDSEPQAARLVGCKVYFPHALTSQDEEIEYTWKFFVGFTVRDEVAGILGEIVEINEQTCNTLFVVVTPAGGELLIPAQETFIRKLIPEKREMIMSLPEGLLDLD